MQTEITKDRLSEYFIPSQNFRRCYLDGKLVDYAEIEVNPEGIKKLEDNLARCEKKDMFDEKSLKELNDSNSDSYEHVVAYVHFDAGTDKFDRLFLSVKDAYSSDDLDVEKIINEEERQFIIDEALKSLHKWRNTADIIDCGWSIEENCDHGCPLGRAACVREK